MYYKYSQYVGYQAGLKMVRSKVDSKELYVCIQVDMVSLTELCHLLKNNLETNSKLLVGLLFWL